MPFTCHLSGRCCNSFPIQVSRQELSEMLQAGPIHKPLNVIPDDPTGTLIIQPGCPWYDKGCTIYEHRPAVCRAYLCFRENVDDPFRTTEEQREFLETHPLAEAQRAYMRENAMERAKEHGWDI